MNMTRSHLIRLYPNKAQATMLAKTAGAARFCYNWGLARWNEMYACGEKCGSYELARLWTQERPEWSKEVYRGVQTKALLNLGGAFTAFFKKTKGKPKPHKKGKHDSFYVDNAHARILSDYLIRLPKIGDVRMAEKLRFSGKIMRYTVSRAADAWYIGVTVEMPDAEVDREVSSPVGVDVGIEHWAVASDGSVLDAPKSIARRTKRLKRYQRIMARRKKGSSNRRKARAKVVREYKRIADIKNDAIHKFTAALVKNHDLVCCEDLNVKGIGRSTKGIRRGVHRSCMGELRRQFAYKARHYVEVNRFFPSSKRCSGCGSIKNELKLSDRTYRCEACGLVLDRDYNASVNLRNEGLRIYTEGHSGHSREAVGACGGC